MSVVDPTWVPRKQRLLEDLRRLRQLLTQPGERFSEIGTLQRAAWLLTPRGRDADSITAMMQLAVERLGANRSADAAAELYGLTEQSRGQTVRTRRTNAMVAYGTDSYHGFRTGPEERIIQELAAALVELLANHQASEPVELRMPPQLPHDPEASVPETSSTVPWKEYAARQRELNEKSIWYKIEVLYNNFLDRYPWLSFILFVFGVVLFIVILYLLSLH